MAPQLSDNGPLRLTEKDELAASATASLEGSVENSSEKVFVEWETLRDDQVDAVFREPGVKTGYRLPNQSWSYYVISLFHVHNETLNTWTHLVGCLIMIYQLYSYASIHGLFVDESRRVIHMFNLCTVLYTFLSTVLHLFHSKSEFVHFVCCQGDYAGIALNTYCSGLGAFYISSHNEYFFRWLEPFFLPLNTTLAWLSYLGSSYAKVFCSGKRSSMRKVLQIGSVVVHIAISCAPVFIRYYECFRSDSCSMSSMSHHTSYLTVLAVSAVFFSSHIPETLFPGKFDIIGQGHQIFHVMVILFSLQQGWAAEIEIELLEKFFPRSFPSWPMLMTSLFTVCLLDLCSAVILGRFVQRKLDKTKHM